MLSSLKTTNHFLEDVSVYPPSKVHQWETTLVVAPHPEDESQGCGGAIALLRNVGFRVHVLYITHGNLGNSTQMPLARPLTKKIREEEAVKALEKLGISEDSATFLHIHNQLVPKRGEPGFEEAVRLCINELESFMPETVLLPCRYHPYEDHYATWEIMQEAVQHVNYPVQVIEYMIWKGSHSNPEIMTPESLKPWRLDIKPVMEQKINALEAIRNHAANNNPSIFSNTQRTLDAQPWETYLQA